MEFRRIHLGSDGRTCSVLCWSVGAAMHGVSMNAEDSDLVLHDGGIVQGVRGGVGAVWC